MKNLLKNWKSLLFNIAELILILLSGYLLKLSIIEILVVVSLFCGVRMITKSAMHYKSWKKCLCWSLFLISSLFILVKVNIFIAICMSIFAAIIISEKGDIKDCFMFERNENKKKYRELKCFVEENRNTEMLNKFENTLKEFNNKYSDRFKINLYEIYYLIFYKKLSYTKTLKEMHLRDDNHIIINALDMIFICYDTYITSENNYAKKESKELAKK